MEVYELKGTAVNALMTLGNTVFAATDNGVYKSDDGLTWRVTSLRVSTYSLAYAGDKVFAGTSSGVYSSPDGGRTWVEAGLRGKRVNALASSGKTVYAGTDNGVYVSVEGAAWKPAGLLGNTISLAVNPSNPRIVYAGTGGFTLTEEIGDLYYSTDGGTSWTRCWLSNVTVLALLFISFPLSYSVTSIIVNPCNSAEVYASTDFIFLSLLVIPTAAGGVEASKDFGSTWNFIGPWPLRRVFSLTSGFNCKWLLAGTDDGVYLSMDKGTTWYGIGPVNTSINTLAISPNGFIYAGTGDGLIVFNYKPWNTTLSFNVEPSPIPFKGLGSRIRVSGELFSNDVKLSGKRVEVLLNGKTVATCLTNFTGGYVCTIPLPVDAGPTLNITVYFPGYFCYMESSATLSFHMVNATTQFGDVDGAGWYRTGSTATVSISPMIIDLGNGTRFVFKKWMGKIISENSTIVFRVEEPVVLLASWETQYCVSVKSEHGSPQGSGWYEADSIVGISISETLVDHGNGTRRIFEGWFEDGTMISAEQTFHLTVDRPISIVAKWETEHRVDVSSEIGITTGSGWYREGATATVSITPTIIERGFFTKYVFEGWVVNGVLASTSPTYSFTVDKTITVTASWRTEMNLVNIGIAIGVVLLIIVVVSVILMARKRRAPLPPPPPPGF